MNAIEKTRNTAVVLTAALMLAAAPGAWAGNHDEGDEVTEPFPVADLYFELNDTDGDLGIHALIDGDPWKKLEIEGLKGKDILEVVVRRNLRRQGLTEFFFESAEPEFDELRPEKFFRRFPEGIYEISAEKNDGGEMESRVLLTHVLAAPANNVMVSGVEASEDCDEEVPAVTQPIVIDWDPVSDSHPELGRSGQVEVVLYQLVVEREDPPLKVSINLAPDTTEFAFPDGMFEVGDEVKYEILIKEASGNQTASEHCFAVE